LRLLLQRDHGRRSRQLHGMRDRWHLLGALERDTPFPESAELVYEKKSALHIVIKCIKKYFTSCPYGKQQSAVCTSGR